jgi:hypothetical protein
MELTQKQEEWLAWLSRVRFLTITRLLAIVVATHELTSLPLVLRYFVPLVLFWYTLAIVYQILLRRIPDASGHATLQTIGDVLMVTGLVYSTGGHESYFTPLYVLVILMSSVLFSRLGVYATATGSFLLLAGMVELTCFSVLPRTSVTMPSVATCNCTWSPTCWPSSGWLVWEICWRNWCAATAWNWRNGMWSWTI